MNDRIQAMEKIFSAESVALIGASNSRSKWGGLVMRNIINGGFKGNIYPVNSKEETIQGLKSYPSILDIPGSVDVVVFTIPASGIPNAISDCVKKGVKAGVVITAGFAELGDEGRQLQEEMLKRARAGGMVLVGPNGQGIAVPSRNFYPWFPTFKPVPGVIGIASQSGAISTELCDNLATFGFGCSKVISAGNCADIGWADYLDYFRHDPETKVVLIYMEGIKDGRRFFEAAKKCALEKPIVLVKSGRTDAGTKAASSHTGSMAGSDALFSSACRQAGIVRADTLGDASIMAAGFVKAPLPRSRRVCILTGGGGHGVLLADAASRRGLELVSLSKETEKKIRELLPPWWSANNPVDMAAGLVYGGPKEIVPILMESDDFDGVILNGIGWYYSMADPINDPKDVSLIDREKANPSLKYEEETGKVLFEYTSKWNKPLLITSNVARYAIRRKYSSVTYFYERQVMVYPLVEDVVNTYSALADRYEFLKKEGRID